MPDISNNGQFWQNKNFYYFKYVIKIKVQSEFLAGVFFSELHSCCEKNSTGVGTTGLRLG
jgi:hypothetical protein